MFGCPRCGNDAVYLADEVFGLIRCEFCGDDIDADLVLQDVDHITHGLLSGSWEELLPALEAELVRTNLPRAVLDRRAALAGACVERWPPCPDGPQGAGAFAFTRWHG